MKIEWVKVYFHAQYKTFELNESFIYRSEVEIDIKDDYRYFTSYDELKKDTNSANVNEYWCGTNKVGLYNKTKKNSEETAYVDNKATKLYDCAADGYVIVNANASESYLKSNIKEAIEQDLQTMVYKNLNR